MNHEQLLFKIIVILMRCNEYNINENAFGNS